MKEQSPSRIDLVYNSIEREDKSNHVCVYPFIVVFRLKVIVTLNLNKTDEHSILTLFYMGFFLYVKIRGGGGSF